MASHATGSRLNNSVPTESISLAPASGPPSKTARNPLTMFNLSLSRMGGEATISPMAGSQPLAWNDAGWRIRPCDRFLRQQVMVARWWVLRNGTLMMAVA